MQQQKIKTDISKTKAELSGAVLDPEKRFQMTSNLREKLLIKLKEFAEEDVSKRLKVEKFMFC